MTSLVTITALILFPIIPSLPSFSFFCTTPVPYIPYPILFSGRFDKVVDVPPPDIGGRKAILELYAKKVPLASDVDMEQLARGTPGFTGAELYNLVNQAAVKASKDGLKAIGMSALEYAKDKIMMGAGNACMLSLIL